MQSNYKQISAEPITSDVGFISVRHDYYEDKVAGLSKGNDLELTGEHVSLEYAI